MTHNQQLAGVSSTLVDQVADSIAEAILDGTFVSDQRLTATHVADWLGVSRTPVREAFMLLQSKRLLDKDSSRSFVVASWEKQDLMEIAQLRSALETLAIELAIARVTPDDLDYLESLVMQMEGALSRGDHDRLVDLDLRLHSTLWEIADNTRLQQMLEDLKIQVRFFMSVTRPGEEGSYPTEHGELIADMRAGDVEKATANIRSHVMATAERAIARLDSTAADSEGIQV